MSNGSYGKSDRKTTEKNVIEYLEHLRIFAISNDFAKVFIKLVRDSGILCKKVKGCWEFKEHNTEFVFIIEHCLDF